MPKLTERKTTVTISLSIAELEKLDKLAKEKGITRSALVREWLITEISKEGKMPQKESEGNC